MQRWMQAKMQLIARHGATRSGCGRPTGGVWDDRKVGHRDETVPGTPKKRKADDRAPHTLANPPMGWGKGRKARRAAQQPGKVMAREGDLLTCRE